MHNFLQNSPLQRGEALLGTPPPCHRRTPKLKNRSLSAVRLFRIFAATFLPQLQGATCLTKRKSLNPFKTPQPGALNNSRRLGVSESYVR
jgi:hypothetical protein